MEEENYEEQINDAVFYFESVYEKSNGILLLLYLCKEGLIEEVRNVELPIENIIAYMDIDYAEVKFSDNGQSWKDRGTYNMALVAHIENDILQNIFDIIMEDIKAQKYGEPLLIFESANILQSMDKTWMNNNYLLMFDAFMSKIQSFKYKDLYYQPQEITKLVLSLANYKGGIVYNPFAGAGSYGLELDAGKNYYGQEINSLTWAVGKLRLMGANVNSDNYLLSDSGSDWKKLKASLIISSPPFGLAIEQVDPFGKLVSKNLAELGYITNGINSLNENGRLIGLFSQSILSKNDSSSIEMKKQVIANDLLDTVILLPANLLQNTGISTAIMLFDKNKANKQFVKFVDGSSFFEKKERINILHWQELFHSIEECDSNFVKIIFNQEIINRKYNLSSVLYLNDPLLTIDIPDGFELKKLADLVKHYRGQKKREGRSRIIRGRDLADEKFAFDKTFEQLDVEDVKSPSLILDKDLLLLLKIGNLKPTFFHYIKGVSVCCNQNIVAFEFNTDVVYPPFIINELGKEYVKKQVEILSSGAIIPFVSISDLLELIVLVPSLKRQNESIDNEKSQYLRELGTEIDFLKESKRNEFEKNMRLRKHAMAQALSNLSSGFTLLELCLHNNNGVMQKNSIVSSKTGETVEIYFAKLKGYVEKIEGMVTKLVDEQVYGQPESIQLISFFNDYIKRHLCDNYSLELLLDNMVNKKDIHAFSISMSPSDLLQAVDNIISNAKQWGFIDASRKDYIIRIIIDKMSENKISIKISNNGASLHQSINRDQFFHWGVGSHTGLGTWQVKNIVEHFKGTVKLNEFPNDPAGFGVEYELVFNQLINLKDE